MGSLWKPVGRAGIRTYWMRRAVVFSGILLLVVTLGSAFAPGRAPAADATRATPQPLLMASSQPVSASAAPALSTAASAAPQSSLSLALPGPCDLANLRVTLAGLRTVKVGVPEEFTASIINAGTAPCVLNLSPANFELRVVSGADRIWSTNDCADWAPTVTRTVAAQSAFEWAMAWPTQRSASGCKLGAVALPGTYVATAEFTGVAPVRVVMDVRN